MEKNILDGIKKISYDIERYVLAGMVRNDDKRYTWVSVLTEKHFQNDSHRRIFRVIVDNLKLSCDAMLILIQNDNMLYAYDFDEFDTYVETMGMLCIDDLMCDKLSIYKTYIDMDDKFSKINPFDPDFSAMQDVAAVVPKQGLNKIKALTVNKCFKLIGQEFLSNNTDSRLRPKYVGWEEIDKMIGGFVDGLTIVSGVAGCGKTTFVIQLIDMFSEYNKDTINFFFSGEIGMRSMAQKIVSYKAKIQLQRIRTFTLCKDDINDFIAVGQKSPGENMYIVECNKITAEEARTYIDRVCLETGKKVGIVGFDYLQIMSPTVRYNTETERINNISGDLREFSKIYPTIAISNLKKDEKNYDSCPSKSDLKGSSDIEFDAGGIFMLYNKDHTRGYEVTLARLKNRFGDGFAEQELNFNGSIQSFSAYNGKREQTRKSWR